MYHISFDPKMITNSFMHNLESCIDSVKRWMLSHILNPNEDKLDFNVFESPHLTREQYKYYW